MAELLLHSQTKQAFEDALKSDAHAFVLLAEPGAGKHTRLHKLAGDFLGIETIEESPSVLLIQAEKGKQSISIEQVRSIQNFLKLKVPGDKRIQRVVVIEDAHLMTHEAQNALLKNLEEPPTDTVLLLSAVPERGLLPTILSRVQQITIRRPSERDIVGHFLAKGYKREAIVKAFQMSDGEVGLIAAILDDDTSHPLVSSINQAKVLVGQTSFERLAKIDELAKNKETLPDLLSALKRVYQSLLISAAGKDKKSDINRFKTALQAILEAETALSKNATPKLVLTDLFLNL